MGLPADTAMDRISRPAGGFLGHNQSMRRTNTQSLLELVVRIVNRVEVTENFP